MGANVTPPSRPRLIIIPAVVDRMLAMPCAWGRISVTVDRAITSEDKAMRVPGRVGFENQWVNEWRRACTAAHVTRNVRK
jgi:hypothetical protein